MSDQDFNRIMIAVLLALAALLFWLMRRSSAREAARHDAVDQRVRALATAHLESGSPFGEGAAAALQGADFWSNPHCKPTGMKDKGLAWNAGWCFGRQQLRDAWRAED